MSIDVRRREAIGGELNMIKYGQLADIAKDITRPTVIAHVTSSSGGYGDDTFDVFPKDWFVQECWYARGMYPCISKGSLCLLDRVDGSTSEVLYVKMPPMVEVACLAAIEPVWKCPFPDRPPGQRGDAVFHGNACDLTTLKWRLEKLAQHAVKRGQAIRLTRLGCKLGKQQWTDVQPIVERALLGLDVTVYG
jgi:hypothetical protein